MASLLLAFDIILLAASDHELQLALGWFAGQCEVTPWRQNELAEVVLLKMPLRCLS